MTNETTKTKRPSSITLISEFSILGGLLSFYFIFQPGVQNFGIGNTLLFAIGGIIFLACGIGFWLMKKWAVYLFAVFAVVDQIFLLVTGKWNILALVLFGIVVYVGYKNLSKMT